jgi:hypothetical protein
VFAVAEMLKKQKEETTEFQNMVLRGIHWLANARAQFARENELLSLMTCLETYFSPPTHRDIKATLAQGVARVLGQEQEHQAYLTQRIRDFYKARSELSHGGYKAVTSDDLVELREIVRNTTAWMIVNQDRLTDKKALLKWVRA